ncbi:MAG: hypothetical protein NTX01_03005 [Candidatus Omnitrophica bacterium]|nr:hypothetical protein [Candidatus Omnitrophota bacterium]
MEYRNSDYANALPSYLDNPALKPRNYYETGLEQGLESIVLNEEPADKGVVDKVFADKGRTLKATVKALFNEILTREKLDSELLKRIDSDICKTDSYLEQIHFLTKRQYTPDLDLAFSRRRTQLESQVKDLEKEKRQEYHECWKDLMFLKKYLLSALKDYWNLGGRKTFLNVENDGCRGSVQKTEAYNW